MWKNGPVSSYCLEVQFDFQSHFTSLTWMPGLYGLWMPTSCHTARGWARAFLYIRIDMIFILDTVHPIKLSHDVNMWTMPNAQNKRLHYFTPCLSREETCKQLDRWRQTSHLRIGRAVLCIARTCDYKPFSVDKSAKCDIKGGKV